VPITAAGSGSAQQLDQAAVQQAHDRLAGATGAYGVTERVVDFQSQGQKVVGTLTLPDGGDQPYPVVLFFTGFTGIRDEVPITGTDEGMFSRTARTLAEHGIASLRFDFRAFGDSEGQREDLTLSGEIADAIAAIDYLATLPEIDLQRLGLIGLSTGGLVAAETAARDARVQSVVLWSPLANAPDNFTRMFGAENIVAGLQSAGEPVRIMLPWEEEIDLKTSFFEDLYNVDPVAAMSTVKRPLLVVVGLKDVDISPQPHYGQLYLNYHEGAELLVAVDGDHLFDVMTDQGHWCWTM
jgi:cephalosporin-C deacetylase-like acetyl esterase